MYVCIRVYLSLSLYIYIYMLMLFVYYLSKVLLVSFETVCRFLFALRAVLCHARACPHVCPSPDPRGIVHGTTLDTVTRACERTYACVGVCMYANEHVYVTCMSVHVSVDICGTQHWSR